MNNFQEYLDEIFNEKLDYRYLGESLPIPDFDGCELILNYTREYEGQGLEIILVECSDRIIEFQKRLIKNQKALFPNAHFLFVSNNGKVFDLYNNATSKKLKKITYDEIGRKTRLFKEKLQLFNITESLDGTELQINAEKAFEANDKVTKSFFDKFKKIHDKLQKAITGITDKKDISWYASVMMNRIMFIYFLQKHYVIQDNTTFLLDKFDEVESKQKDYYKDFLLPLFFYGFARKDNNVAKQRFVQEFGPIKYLNGGLFYPHHIEKKYSLSDVGSEVFEETALQTKIGIDGKLIKEILDFLDGYTWYLDSRPMKEDTDINPDVLGYIFEKYINQKELGAYYTKEDITEYISKNCIVPFIFNKMSNNGFLAPDPKPLISGNKDILFEVDKYIDNITDYEEIKFLYKNVLLELSVIDPSVGSGAFLFAALNILLPINQKVIFKLREFEKTNSDSWIKEILSSLGNCEEYHLTKQIILNNLYGVDIVEEATEICKLRLFLQLASHLPDIKSIEPLPDIDFNIYSGNSLVGGLSWEDLEANYTMDLFTSANREYIKTDIKTLSDLKIQYRAVQQKDDNEEELSILKDNIASLEHRVNQDIKIGIINPFHWFIDFNNIIEKGGFDVIIGNPPYVEYSKIKKEYQIRGFSTEKCGNLYGNFIERSIHILSKTGYTGFIIPISFSCTKRMESVQKMISSKVENMWLSHYAERPSKLFEGAEVLLNILIFNKAESKNTNFYTTSFLKWKSEEREALFSSIRYISTEKIRDYLFPKFGYELEGILWRKIQSNNQLNNFLLKKSENYLYYRIGGGRYWKIFTDFQPKFVLNNVEGTSSRENYLYFATETQKYIAIAVLSSSLFYWYFINSTNCRDLNPFDLQSFPISLDSIDKKVTTELVELAKALMEDYHVKSQIKNKVSKSTGNITYQEFYPRLSKSILDLIDNALGKHYGFTEEELKFIVNFDVQYRMGSQKEDLE